MSGQPAANATLDLAHYVRVLRYRWLTIVVVTALGVGAALAYLAARPTHATASALVNVNVISLEPFNNSREPSGLIDAQTEVQTARSSAVVGRTAEVLGGDLTPGEVRDALTVSLVADATVLRISYTDDTVTAAVTGADEAARQFLTYRGELAAQRLATVTEQLTQRRDLLRDDLLRVNEQLAAARPGSSAAIQAESDRQLLNLELDSLVGQINAINGIDTTGGTVLTAASDVGAFLSPRRGMVLVTGFVGGLLLGLVAAFVRHALDRRIFDARDIADAGAGPVLAQLRARHATVPPSPADADAVRSAWEQLLTALPSNHPVVAVADLSSPEAPAEVAAVLALAAGEPDRTVELVLPEYPRVAVNLLHTQLDLVAITPIEGGERYRSTLRPQLTVSVLDPRSVTAEAPAVLLKKLLASEDRSAATTVIALPPVASRSLRLVAGRLAHAAVVVVTPRDTRTARLAELVAEMGSVRTEVAGTLTVPRRRGAHAGTEEAGTPAPASGPEPALPPVPTSAAEP